MDRPDLRAVLAWGVAATVLPAGTTAALWTRLPPDPLAALERPTVGPEAGDARDGRGPWSRGALRAATEALQVTDGPDATDGFHLRLAATSTEVQLTDRAGVVRHRWTSGRDAFGRPTGLTPWFGVFRDAVLRPDGGLYVLVEGVGVVALGRDGTHEWTAAPGAHDHLERLPNGRIRVLVHEPQPIFELSRLRVYLVDRLVELDEQGTVKRRRDLLKLYRASTVDWRPTDDDGDLFGASWFHTDPVDGLVYVTLRRRNAVAVVDVEARRLVREERGDEKAVGPTVADGAGGRWVVDQGPAEHGLWLRRRGPDGATALVATLDWGYDPLSPGFLQALPGGHVHLTAGTVRELDAEGRVVWTLVSPATPPLPIVMDQWLPPDCCAWLDGEAP